MKWVKIAKLDSIVHNKNKLNQSTWSYFDHQSENSPQNISQVKLCTSNINLRSLKDKGRDQVGIKAPKFKLCPDVCSEVNHEVNLRSACQCYQNLINQSCLLGKFSVVQSGFYHKPTGFGKVGDKYNIFYFKLVKASTFMFLDWW